MNVSDKITKLEALQTRLRASKFRQSKIERSEVIGKLAGLLADEGFHDAMLNAGHIFSVDGLSSDRYESAQHQVDMMVTSGITRLENGNAPSQRGGASAIRQGGSKIFIGHGRSLMWRELKDFLQDRLKFDWEEFNRVPTAGVSTIARLSAMLDGCCFAVLILTAEDQQKDRTFHPRQNVVHEAGLFQGRLGFERAVIVMEDGCEEFSNIAGLGQIRFPKGHISACFEEVRRVLERERLLPSSP